MTNSREPLTAGPARGQWMLHAASCAIVMVAPIVIVRHDFPWGVAAPTALQAWASVAGYLALALYTSRMKPRGWISDVARVTIGAILVFGAAYALLTLWPDAARSRLVFGVSACLSAALVLQPLQHGRTRIMISGATAIGVLMLGVWSFTKDPGRQLVGPRTFIVQTALTRIEVRHYTGLTGRPQDTGGAIASYRGAFLVSTAAGALFRVGWDSNHTGLRAERIAIASPITPRTPPTDQRKDAFTPRLRATGLAIDTTRTPARVYVTHSYWNETRQCMTLRVSAHDLDDSSAASTPRDSAWTTEFEAKPCLSVKPPYDDSETGGRLAWTPAGDLLLTVGDHGFSGFVTAFAQADTADYGKVHIRDARTGRWRVFTKGHRNPQGLTVGRNGLIWETEHGPQGGDEVNVLADGGNYGWPYVTYGTAYGRDFWPWALNSRDHGKYREPAFAFVPSVAISSVIELDGVAFPKWKGDLMAGSLASQSVFRLRTRGNVVSYVEQIRIGRRVRDLAEDGAGTLILWTDEGDLVTLERPDTSSSPETAFALCAGCHEPPDLRLTPYAPSLRGVIGRKVASDSTYPFTSGVRSLGGRWTAERLDAFLKDPAAYAPGTRMSSVAVADSAERRWVIEYLRRY